MTVSPDTRRFLLCLLASLLVNSVALVLTGRLWRPLDSRPPAFLPHIRLISLPPPVPAKVQVAPSVPVTTRRPTPPPKVSKPPRPPKPRRPGSRVHSSSAPPPARPTGGADAGAPAAPQVAAAPPAAPAPKVITAPRPARLVARVVDTSPALAASPLPPSPAAAPITAVPDVPAKIGKGSGSGEAGKASGAGEGAGKGAGAGPGTGLAAGEPFGVGQGLAGDGGPRHVVYVLDISGSMTSRIDRAEAELTKALDGLRPGETFNIIAFSDRIQPFYTGEMASATPQTEREAEAFLGSLQVDGGTDLEGALSRALSLPDVNEVVVLTDGVPTAGETDFKALARRVRELNTHHARISTVGMVGKNPDGTDDSFEAAHLLQQIARDSGGQFKLVTLGVATPE